MAEHRENGKREGKQREGKKKKRERGWRVCFCRMGGEEMTRRKKVGGRREKVNFGEIWKQGYFSPFPSKLNRFCVLLSFFQNLIS